jgi:DNA polymerase-3 subunit beta
VTIISEPSEQTSDVQVVSACATVNAVELKKALQRVKPAVGKRGGGLPVIAGVHVQCQPGEITLTATDLDLTLQTGVKAEGVVNGRFVVGHKLLWDFVGTATAKTPDVTLQVTNGDDVQVRIGKLDVTLRGLPVDEWPRMSSVEMAGVVDGETIVLNADALAAVIPAACTDPARPILCGVHVNDDEIVATDSYRLFCVRGVPSTGMRINIPARAVDIVAKHADNSEVLAVVANHVDRYPERGDNGYMPGGTIQFLAGDLLVTTRLIEGAFPNYKGLIPENTPGTIEIDDLDDFRFGLKHVARMAREATPVRLEQDEDGPFIAASTQDVGDAKYRFDGRFTGAWADPIVESDGDKIVDQSWFRLALNPEYLADNLAGIERGEIAGVDALKPCVMREPFGDTGAVQLRLLMPVRVG